MGKSGWTGLSQVVKSKYSQVTALVLVVIITLGIGVPILLPQPSPARGEDLLEPLSSVIFYTVRSGDTMWSIARLTGYNPFVLAAYNSIEDPDNIVVGQKVFLPATDTIPHLVRKGETVASISRRYGVSVKDIVETNDLFEPDLIKADQVIKIPVAFSLVLPTGKEVDDKKQVVSRKNKEIITLQFPVKGWISSPFGPRGQTMHEGIDIAANYGTEVRAAADGRVIYAGEGGTYGLMVILEHGGGWTTLYAHCSRLLVKPGEQVREGQVIALVGSTGRSKGPHLHFEVRRNGVPVDPESGFFKRARN